MRETPYLNAILDSVSAMVTVDSAEEGQLEGACTELEGLKNALEVSKREHEATSKALYHLQFVQHEELLNKYCALRDAMKALVEGMGYTVKPK